MTDAPKRAHVFNLEIGADTAAELVRALHQIAEQLDRGEISNGCSGGHNSGWTYSYAIDETMTHERYITELTAWLKAKRLLTP